MSFKDKVYVVTGGASGIGLATAKMLSDRGSEVCIADVDIAALREVESYFSSGLPDAIFTITQVDISKRDQAAARMAGIKEQFRVLDVVPNIAGVTGKDHGLKTTAEVDDGEWNKIIGVN